MSPEDDPDQTSLTDAAAGATDDEAAGVDEPSAADGGGDDPGSDSDVGHVDASHTRAEKLALGVDLLAHLEAESLPLSALVDRLETVTTNPSLTREILETAERRGLIERTDATVRVHNTGVVRFESDVVRREGDFECRRCGTGITTGHFLRLDAGELGPFGSSCIRKVTGRE